MTVTSSNPEILSELDRPNSYIGKVVPRPNLERLMQGRGLYVGDMELPRMGHVVFLRSPHAHAKIVGIDTAAAKRLPGVIAVVTGERACGRRHAMGWRIVAFEGLQIGAAACDRDRSRLLAGRSRRRDRGDQPRRGGGRRGNRQCSNTRSWRR